LNELKRMSARFAKTPLEVDVSKLSSGDRKALAKLMEAAHLVDDIFLTQYWSGNHELCGNCQQDKTPLGQARAHYFWLSKGPCRRSDGGRAFLFQTCPRRKVPGANFLSRRDEERRIRGLGERVRKDQRELAEGFFSVDSPGERTSCGGSVQQGSMVHVWNWLAKNCLREAAADTEKRR